MTGSELEDAVAVLRRGGLVAMPTETVYGLAADAANPEAVARIFEAKGRPRFNPLIAHVSSMDMARGEAEFCETSRQLAETFWPGPLTLVLPVETGKGTVCDLARAGLPTLALRMPDHAVALELIANFSGPLVAPSANPSGRLSPTQAGHVREGLGDRVDRVLDGGPCRVGLESTIVSVSDGEITLLREGAVSAEAIARVTGQHPSLSASNPDRPSAPGQLLAHYAPNAPLRLNALSAEGHELLIGFGPIKGEISLSPGADLIEAAANLFAQLHTADASGRPIAVAPVPDEGLGRAINDRLRRAAAAHRPGT